MVDHIPRAVANSAATCEPYEPSSVRESGIPTLFSVCRSSGTKTKLASAALEKRSVGADQAPFGRGSGGAHIRTSTTLSPSGARSSLIWSTIIRVRA